MLNRRIFLRNSALAMAGIGAAPRWLERAAFAASDVPKKKVLVTIFQRGAADGLNIVAPHGEAEYYKLRPSIALARPGAEETAAIDLDGFFGLHPALEPLKPWWNEGNLAIIHAAGSPDPTRSHFDAQDYMESGTPGWKATSDGWLNRALPVAEGKVSPVRAVALGASLPRALRGTNSAVAVESLPRFEVREAHAAEALETMYMQTGDQLLGGTGRETFEAVHLLQSLQKTPYQAAAGASYPRGRLGSSLQQIAQLIKADVGLEVAFADLNGWDHHVNEPALLTNSLREFGGALAAFAQDLGSRMADVLVVTMSEFGRTARENGNRGTDHGHGNVMFALGGNVKGGKVYGDWPGLGAEQLYQGRDLAVTTDFRSVLSEAVAVQLGNPRADAIFPHYAGNAEQYRGWLKV